MRHTEVWYYVGDASQVLRRSYVSQNRVTAARSRWNYSSPLHRHSHRHTRSGLFLRSSSVCHLLIKLRNIKSSKFLKKNWIMWKQGAFSNVGLISYQMKVQSLFLSSVRHANVWYAHAQVSHWRSIYAQKACDMRKFDMLFEMLSQVLREVMGSRVSHCRPRSGLLLRGAAWLRGDASCGLILKG